MSDTQNIFSFTDNGSLQYKFLSSHHLKIPEKVILLHNLVEQRGPATDDWPDSRVQPIGTAHTYQEALAKLEKLKTVKNVSTDCENGNREAEEGLTNTEKPAPVGLGPESSS
ncbi:hypothetical protein QAD02_000485 [Eretmocerus hayati]|uniref:Uncharacterized protein n=1 Tax=Eretmocerus hayati TaxID=131215 RepID=A0ACC2NE98_9HYME|nr:hypothetical protein QAD02_000485 [Eretmocerus hayati]